MTIPSPSVSRETTDTVDTMKSAFVISRESYRTISLYAPNREPAAIDLSDNTNLWGVPPQAFQTIHAATTSSITRYPALYVNDLKRTVSSYLDVAPEMVTTGCGSDDVLDSAIRAFGNPGETIVHPDPSFAMIPIFAKVNGLIPTAVPLTDSFDVDPERVLATNAKIIYLCSPNNPTGTSLSRSAIETIVDRARGLVIIDEAYAEFADINCIDLLQRSERLLITRTCSKAFGLAGLRIGYAIGNPTLIAEVEKSRGPYKVNAIAERAAVTAMTEDYGWVQDKISEAKANRDRLATALREIGLVPLPSNANFLLVPVQNAVTTDQKLRERGIAVRPFTKLPGIGDALRISIGPWEMLERCVQALREVLA